MKIGVAQIKSLKGNIQKNIETHKKWIEIATSKKVDLIAFPELSLTGYEPQLAEELATDQNDSRLDEFQKISNYNKITIALGLPTKSESGIRISMVIFQPDKPIKTYSKQKLHADELPYFTEGSEQIILTIKNTKIAPAICYESLQEEHLRNVKSLEAEIYLASVAKSQNGIKKAFSHFPKIAKKYSIPVLMSNCIGVCDNFESAGQSTIWDANGILVGSLDSDKEGIIIFDTETGKVHKKEKATFNKV